MKIRIVDYEEEPMSWVATHIDMWYNPHTRLWELIPMNDKNYQVGDTVYAYGKKDALLTKREMEKDLSKYSYNY